MSKMTPYDQHMALVDAVNDSTCISGKNVAEAMLEGFRRGYQAAGFRLHIMDCDLHSMERFGDRPMCCGVLLDWKPAETGGAS